MESAVARRYILLRSREGNHAGYARLEVRHGRGTVALRMAVPGRKGAVRILLLAGDAETGSVLDLGVSPLDGEGQGQCYRDNLPLPGGFKLYHTLAVVSDWPTPALLLHGPLGARTPPLWQLEDAVTRYLAVPVERPASRPDAARPTPSASPAPAPDASARCWKPPLPPSVRPRLTVGALPVLCWPKGLAELPGWFASLPPAAPFDAPGWRFVEVPLAADAPAASCAVGILARGGRLLRVAYALPGRAAALPPGGLRDYCWMQGRHGQGYWVRFQTLSPNYAALPPQQDAYTALP